MNCKHIFQLEKTDFITVDGKKVEVNIWKCDKCGKLYIQDCKTVYRIRLNGRLGTEID